MGPDLAKGQQDAWKAYDKRLQDERIEFLEEPAELEAKFRALTKSPQASPKEWADSYVLAFAAAAGLRLVSFDRALRQRTGDVLLLE
jgi:predicted nucleic acid-binding protein